MFGERELVQSPSLVLPVRNELTYIGHVILRGTRIVVPTSLRKRVTELAHEDHLGIVKMKERLRSKEEVSRVSRMPGCSQGVQTTSCKAY